MRGKKRIWSHSPDLRPPVDYERLRKEYLKHVSTLDESVDNIDRLVSAGTAFSHVRIGDIEAAFLTLPYCSADEIAEIKRKLWWCGVDPEKIPDTESFRDVIRKATIVGIHSPLVNDDPFWWASSYDMLRLTGLWRSRARWDEVHAIYQYADSDHGLFPRLAGRKVVLVGGKVDVFHRYFYRHPHYRESFPWLGLEKIEIIAVIKTPDLPDFCMNRKSEIMTQVRGTYERKPEVYLISCGILAKHLAVMVEEEIGAAGLDIGNVIECMMNLGKRRPFIKRFAGYSHSEYEFIIGDHMRITDIKRRE